MISLQWRLNKLERNSAFDQVGGILQKCFPPKAAGWQLSQVSVERTWRPLILEVAFPGFQFLSELVADRFKMLEAGDVGRAVKTWTELQLRAYPFHSFFSLSLAVLFHYSSIFNMLQPHVFLGLWHKMTESIVIKNHWSKARWLLLFYIRWWKMAISFNNNFYF